MDTEIASTFKLLWVTLLWHSVQIPLQYTAFNSLTFIYISGIGWSYGNFILKFFEELPYFLPQRLYHFKFSPTVHKGSNIPHFFKHLFSAFLMVAIASVRRMGIRRYLTVIFSCIFIMNSDVHLFICLVAIHKSSLGKCLFKSFAHIWIWHFCCSVLGVLYIFWLIILKRFTICKYILPFCDLWIVSFDS